MTLFFQVYHGQKMKIVSDFLGFSDEPRFRKVVGLPRLREERRSRVGAAPAPGVWGALPPNPAGGENFFGPFFVKVYRKLTFFGRTRSGPRTLRARAGGGGGARRRRRKIFGLFLRCPENRLFRSKKVPFSGTFWWLSAGPFSARGGGGG